MKELSIISRKNDWGYGHFSRHLFKKLLLGTTITAFLSNASPVYAKSFDIIKQVLQSIEKATAVYSQDKDNQSSFNISDASKVGYLTVLNKALAEKVNASGGYADFLTRTLSGKSDDNPIAISSLDGAYNPVVLENDITTFSMNPMTRTDAPMTRANDGIDIGTYTVALGWKAKTEKKWGVSVGHMAHALGQSSVAIGGEYNKDSQHGDDDYTTAKGDYTTAVGAVSKALGYGSTALGHRAYAFDQNAISIGFYSKASGNGSITLGSSAEAKGPSAIAIGANTVSSGLYSVALGYQANASVQYAIAMGSQATASGNLSLAVGQGAQALASSSTALGFDAKGEGINAIALGSSVRVSGNAAIGLGFSVKASGEYSVAIGNKAKASGKDSVAIGSSSVSDRAAGVFGYAPSLKDEVATNDTAQWKSTRGAVSVGDYANKITRQITGVAAGSNVTDAANVGQLKDLKRFVKENGWKLSVGGKNGKTVLMDSDVDFSAGSTNLKITKGDEDNKVKFDLSQDVTLTSLKAGTNTLDATGLVITGGPKITTGGIDAGNKKITSIKDGTLSADSHEAVSGSQLFAANNEIANVRDSILVKQVTEMSLSRSLRDSGAGLITIGRGTGGNEISVLNKDHEGRKLSGLMGGDLSEDSNEAVIGSQLFETNQNVNTVSTNLQTAGKNIAETFGGGAKYENEKWIAPTFTLKTVNSEGKEEDKSYPNVAEALTGVGTSFTNVQNKITKEITNQINSAITTVQGESLIKKDKETNNINIGREVEGSEINIANSKSELRTLSGVKEATKADEAINKGQFDKGVKGLTEDLQFESSFAVHYDKISNGNGDQADYTNITLGKGKNPTALHNVANGTIAKDSYDAINGGQINTIGEDIAKFLGGKAIFKSGTFTAPTYDLSSIDEKGNITAKSFSDVGLAFTGLNTNIKAVNARIKEVSQSVAQDSLSWSAADNAFSAQHGEGKERRDSKIKFLIGGDLSNNSTEAVNGGQIYTLGSHVASFFGGDAEFQNGQWNDPTFKIKTLNDDGTEEEQSYTNVAEAFKGVGTIVTNIKNDITKVKVENLVQQEKATNNITIGAKKEGSVINIANSKNEKRTLTGIKDGTADADAVNFSQLKGVKQEIKDKVKEVQEQVAASSLVKQDAQTKHISIGKDTDGDKIDIANNKNEKRTLTGIKDGALSKDSNEAVTGSQLFTINQNVTIVSTNLQTAAMNIAKSFGGSAKYENGVWSAPTFTLKTVKDDGSSEEKIYNNVTEAFSGVGTSFTNVQKQVTEQINHVINKVESENLVQQEKATNNITIGAKIEGSIINIANKNGEARILSGVKEATKDNEAVNKGQLDTSIKDANNEITNKFNDFTKNITNITQQVKGDALLWSEADKAFIADHGEGSAKTNSKITHLLDGVISSNSKDAITGSQLYSLGNAVSTSLGGGASYEEGSWIAPTFTVNKFDIKGNATQEDYKTVADALSGLSTSLTNTQNKITNEIAHIKGESLVKQDDKTKLIMIGGEKDGTLINIANKDKEDRRLSGVRAAENANEAVNKAQLDKLDKKIESTNSFAVLYDKKSDDTVNYKSVTFGGKNKESVVLHNVADGALSQESHDAINGGQITKILQQVVKYFGGNAAFKEGIFTGPIYKLLSISENGTVGETDHDNIVSAFEGLDTNIKNVNQRIKEVSEGISNDSLLWDKNKEAYVALHGEGETRENSKITYLKDGDITANSSDAVNGSQLYSLNEQLATYFGGGAGYDKKGNWQAPNFKIKQFGEDGVSEEKSYSNISDALSEVGNSFTNIQNKMTYEISKIESENLVKQDEKTKLITIGGEKDGREISIANSASGVRSLSGVKAGLLTAESTEAVNGSQLYSVINALSRYFSGDAGYKDGQWLAPNFKVAQFTADGVVSKKEDYTNVASAFEGVNESMTNINNRIHDFEQSVFSGGLNWSETEKAFDAHHKGQDSKIKHVADGEISEGSKEAVNGSQLWQTNKKVEEVENHVNMIDKQVKDIASVADIAVKYDKGNDGKKKNKVTLVGVSESDPVLIDNVADGRIESGSKEAVTGGQLHDYTDQQMRIVLSDAKKYTDERFNDVVTNTVNNIVHDIKSYTDIKFEALRYEIKEIRKESRQAAAIGLAVSNLSYEETPGSVSLSIGMGMWRNQSAFAVGAGYVSENGRIRSNISATSSGNHWGVGAGLRVKLN
ncbi:Vomp family autotransporter [Bartonella tribocorum]|uniref:Vomp family autotransporter n=1 Tax=Bartonella tribocorum TaxID=85701 RepID=UPI001ABA7662|nr:Vomp family autotransporter [Bartonella tribocorum]